ncbi:MAG TPA: putative monovalent cation/H+ antiporter subunit A [Candidatus Limnocylindria bacterium]|nr:putative monovalent cation/H+ antiporter subunit A [Candidatus Limnocylindria bacterium]
MSGLAAAVLSGFVLAAIAPLVARSRHAGWLLALLPAGLTAYFLSLAPRVLQGERVSEQISWVPSLGLQASFALDGLGLLFALLICGIGALVLIYAGGYLAGHPHLPRFYVVILAFMASMLGIVLADNLLLLYVFWGGTSITSYLLIGFDHEQDKARSSAQQALLVTVGGELALLGGLVLLASVGGTFEISALSDRGGEVRADPLYLPILGLVLLGALTKSAQFPFHFWLPNAMAAPAPVSAYLHSATMVKAGIFLLARLFPVLGGTDAWTIALVASGGATLLIGAFLSYHAVEVKRVLAYSTVAALGMMVLLLGVGTEHSVTAAMVFLLGHAFYKGTLFLFAGAADHEARATRTDQLPGLRRVMPISAAAAALAGLSMAGLLPFFGFIGKELVFESLFELPGLAGPLLLAVAVAGNALLVVVALRVGLRPLMRATDRRPKGHEAPVSLWLGPLLLSVLGVTTGLLPAWLASELVSAAVSSTILQPVDVELALWHGLTLILGFSLLTLLVGLGLYAWRARLRAATAPADMGRRVGPEQAYAGLTALTNQLARRLTGWLQNGYLRHYLVVTLVTGIGLVSAALLRASGLEWGLGRLDLRVTEVGLAVLVLVGAFVAVRSQSRMGTVAALGVVGFGIALIYLNFGAPDLAMTQVLIETLTVIVFVLVLYHLPSFSTERPRPRVRDAAVSLGFGAMMTALVLFTLTPEVRESISRFFLERSLPDAHGRNVVNVILVDFRALDTMGEIAVLALAGLGVFVLLRIHAEHRQARR